MKALFRNELGRVQHAAWEWHWMRLLFAPFIWMATFPTFRIWTVDLPDAIDAKEPNGLGQLIPLEWLGQDGPTCVLAALLGVLLLLYIRGRGLLWVTGGLVLLHAAAGSLLNSPRGSHHAAQIVGLVLVGQFAWEIWRACRRPGDEAATSPRPRLDAASGSIFWSQQMICAAYVVSAISKWVNSGGGWVPGWRWVEQTPNIVVQFEKNQMQGYYDKLEMPPTDLNRGLMEWFGEHPVLAMLCIAPGFYLELFAFLALFNRAAAAVMGVLLILLHFFIALIMHLEFRFFIAADLIFLVNLPYWLACLRRTRGA